MKPCQRARLYYFKKTIDKILNFWYNICTRFFKKKGNNIMTSVEEQVKEQYKGMLDELGVRRYGETDRVNEKN